MVWERDSKRGGPSPPFAVDVNLAFVVLRAGLCLPCLALLRHCGAFLCSAPFRSAVLDSARLGSAPRSAAGRGVAPHRSALFCSVWMGSPGLPRCGPSPAVAACCRLCLCGGCQCGWWRQRSRHVTAGSRPSPLADAFLLLCSEVLGSAVRCVADRFVMLRRLVGFAKGSARGGPSPHVAVCGSEPRARPVADRRHPPPLVAAVALRRIASLSFTLCCVAVRALLAKKLDAKEVKFPKENGKFIFPDADRRIKFG